MSTILTLRVSAGQRKRWQEAANREGLTVSAWVRKHCDLGFREKEHQAMPPKKTPAEVIAELIAYPTS